MIIDFQLEAEFSRLTNVSARRQFFSTLDENAENLLELLKERSGMSGKTIQEYLSSVDTATVSKCSLFTAMPTSVVIIHHLCKFAFVEI